MGRVALVAILEPGRLLDAIDVLVGQAQVMADLVHEHGPHDVLERQVDLAPLVENGPARKKVLSGNSVG